MYADDPTGASKSLVYGDVAVMFLFQGFYSIAWTPLLYLYPPEIMNYSIRANGLAVSQLSLNALALVFVFIMPIGLNNIGWKMYMVNGSWDIVILVLIVCFCYFNLLFPSLTFLDRILGRNERQNPRRNRRHFRRRETLRCSGRRGCHER